MISLFDWYDQETADLHHSLKQAGFLMPTVVLEETGFLPDDVLTPYAYFTKWQQKGKARYFNEIPIERYDEIKANNNDGGIYDEEVKKATIIFETPGSTDRMVKEVLYHAKGNEQQPWFKDHYNQYGFRFAQTTFDQDGKASMKFYYNEQGNIVIAENLLIGDVILNYQGRVYQFARKIDFFKFFIQEANLDVDRIIYNTLATSFFITLELPNRLGEDTLFWHEKLANPDELPGNMQHILNNKSQTNHIYFQVKDDFDYLMQHKRPEYEMISYLGYIYSFVRENKGNKDILIMTNSDQIEQLTNIVEGLPEYRFHIGALTEMSTKLMAYQQYDNVTLYPNISPQDIDVVFEKCDIYLDINYGNEIIGALRQAFLNNMIILGFNETNHRHKYIMDENIFDIQNVEQLIKRIRTSDVAEDVVKQQKYVGNMEQAEYKVTDCV